MASSDNRKMNILNVMMLMGIIMLTGANAGDVISKRCRYVSKDYQTNYGEVRL